MKRWEKVTERTAFIRVFVVLLLLAVVWSCKRRDGDGSENPAAGSVISDVSASVPFRCIGDPSPAELRCLAYWRSVLDDYPDFTSRLRSIIEHRRSERSKDNKNKPSTHQQEQTKHGPVRLVVKGESGEALLSAESIRLVVTDLNTTSLKRLLKTLERVRTRTSNLNTRLNALNSVH